MGRKRDEAPTKEKGSKNETIESEVYVKDQKTTLVVGDIL